MEREEHEKSGYFQTVPRIINAILMTLKNRLGLKVHKLNLVSNSPAHLVYFILTINTICTECSLIIESKYGITKVSPHLLHSTYKSEIRKSHYDII